jgi:hypothetical protein
MKQRKSYDFSAIGRSIQQKMAERDAYVFHERPAVIKAALLLTFDPETMEMEDEDRRFLEASCSQLSETKWELNNEVRNKVLLALKERKELHVNYTRFGVREEKYTKEQSIFGAVLKGWKIKLDELSVTELNVLFRVVSWVDGGGYDLPSRDSIRNTLDRLSLARKFGRQTANFKGREEELKALRDYVYGGLSSGQNLESYPPMLVYGIGGIGKSTLIGRFLVKEAIQVKGTQLPFAYLDFDHPGLSISNPLALFAAGFRQIVAQFPAGEGEEALLENALGSLQATLARRNDSGVDEFGNRTKPVTKFSSNVSIRSWEQILGDLSRRYLKRAKDNGWEPTSPILIVLDSFEEAQYRSGETVIRNFLEFLNSLTELLPNIRLLIVGRSDLVVSPFNFRKLPVGDFDEAATLAYLEAVGVKDYDVRHLIQQRVGGNPLTLKLAAALVEKEGVGEKISLAEFAKGLAGTQVQELLVRRNIDHIRDPEVKQLALPGMLLRRIDTGVIQKVLAPICGLGKITEEKARSLYEGLQRVTFLIELLGGEIHFRRDLRIALRDEIWRKERGQCIALHREAADYYGNHTDDKGQAEHYYHVFQLNGKPGADADEVDWKRLRPFLEDALMELPPQAAAYLARQFSVRLPQEIMDKAGQEENDWSMIQRMEEVAINGIGGMNQMEEVWNEVESRQDSNEFFFIYYRQILALRLGYYDRMLDDLTPRALAKLEGMEVYLEVLRSNYTQDYIPGLTLAKDGDFLKLTPRQVLEAGVLVLKFQGLLLQPFDEAFVKRLSQMAADFPAEDPSVKYGPQQNWRLFSDRLWDVRQTSDQEKKAQFYGLCQAIHSYFTAGTDEYPDFVARLAEVNVDNFSLVLRNETKKLLEDIAVPGTPEVVAHDYVDFLVERYGGDWYEVGNFIDRATPLESEAPTVEEAEAPAPIQQPLPSPKSIDGKLPSPKLIAEADTNILDAQKLIQDGRLNEAIDKIAPFIQKSTDEGLINQFYLLQFQSKSLETERIQGTMTHDDGRREEARLVMSLLEVIQKIE